MEFIFETNYDLKATTAISRTIRKTSQKKFSNFSNIISGIGIVLLIICLLPEEGKNYRWDFFNFFTLIALLLLVCSMIFKDQINGFVRKAGILKGTEKSKVTFSEEGYYIETEIVKSEWTYKNIYLLLETKDYFIFLLSPSHAQIFDKHGLTVGTEEDFRIFIKDKIQKEFIIIN